MNQEYEILQQKISEMQRENERWSKKFNSVMSFQNKGSKLEKKGDIDGAIEQYKAAINKDREEFGNKGYAVHSAERLFILYRKKKDYEREILAIHQAQRYDPGNAKYKERLAKAESLLEKQK